MVAVSKRYLVIGGAGFIGSHFVNRLISENKNVVVLDNLSSGKYEFISHLENEGNFQFINDDVLNWKKHESEIGKIDTIIHLASNADISAAITDPTLDFFKGTLLTQFAAEIARELNVEKFLYASGSGVYGDYGNKILDESSQELKPISPYGASKLSGEVILRAYSHMFDFQVICFRFGNVVGANQTHGVGFDFLNKLRSSPNELQVLGDGTQEKPYIHVSDVVEAVLFANKVELGKFEAFNVATTDYLKVSEIVDMALNTSGIEPSEISINYQRQDRGWKGDVPIVKLDSSKIRQIGWSNKLSSKEAMAKALKSLWENPSVGVLKN